ncbi:chitin synthase [Favolaschia claudopus]|uniref:Chitin synthase n=1 Tax=Favolaschia claudopus TaxID=2862362 RepID=A0AAW0CYC8_9AGAR
MINPIKDQSLPRGIFWAPCFLPTSHRCTDASGKLALLYCFPWILTLNLNLSKRRILGRINVLERLLFLTMRPVFALPVTALLPVVHGALLLGFLGAPLTVGNTSIAASSASRSTTTVSTSASPANFSVSSILPTSSVVRIAAVPRKRAAIPACLKTVELSCLNLAANCIDSVNAGNVNTLWSIKSCVAAGTCYGVGDLITSVECQTGFIVTNSAQAALPTSVSENDISPIHAITQQNYIDFYYGQLTAVNSANFPSSSDVVKAFWSAITTWAATGSTVPHVIVFGTTTTPITTYTQITWNPNPAPTSGAVSETFVKSPTTVIIAIPTATTSVVVGGTSITLAPGGTPINSPLPPGISIPGATTPTWNPNIIPPTSVPSVTFTAPPSFTTVVAVPTASNSPPKNITGPPGDKNSDGNNWWLLVFPGIIGGLLPADIGIPGGVKPTAAPPPDWTGAWTDPDPTSTSTHNSASASSSASSSSSSCPRPTGAYSLSDDAENSDWDGLGSDPDRRRSNVMSIAARAGRSMTLPVCGIDTANGNVVINPNTVSLGAGTYYTIGTKAAGGTSIALNPIVVNSRPVGNGAGTVAQEHIFEIGYIRQFFESINGQGISCNWIVNNVYNQAGWDGRTWALSLLQEIDQVPNMVWVDKPMNQAKSNVVNRNKATAADPPQKANIDKISDFSTTVSVNSIQDVEYFIRNFAALGTYFSNTAGRFQATALRVQNRLTQITPNTPDVNLPVAFNAWLRSLLTNYPSGCTSRAANVFDYYHTKMTSVANQHNSVVPQCFPLFPTGLYDFQNLVPPPPTLPSCNIPGTQGTWQFGINPNGSPEKGLATFRVMGAGRSDFYGFGTGADFSGAHLVAGDLSTTPGCANGAVSIGLTGPGVPAGLPDVLLSPQCNGQTGKQTVPISFVLNGQTLSCASIYTNQSVTGSQGIIIQIICAGSAAVATTCANSVLSSTYPTGHLLTGSMTFIPS